MEEQISDRIFQILWPVVVFSGLAISVIVRVVAWYRENPERAFARPIRGVIHGLRLVKTEGIIKAGLIGLGRAIRGGWTGLRGGIRLLLRLFWRGSRAAKPSPGQTKSDDSTEKKEELPEEGPLPSEAEAVAGDKGVDMQPAQGRPPSEAEAVAVDKKTAAEALNPIVSRWLESLSGSTPTGDVQGLRVMMASLSGRTVGQVLSSDEDRKRLFDELLKHAVPRGTP